MYLSNKN